eukprot:CAMPEP_0175128704 /NCGR_PEP_ID=MMETSP0087-20121206/5074_1 /TAXON_ID=136419 /ORGANISM="Unknown Unknown, Strain D1" /LENGTH=232 /DNA_ID=CAMNT_0016410791 /DNA_START=55 /DNA_END=751 /DNA_ORIENTATION=+
MRGKQAIAGKIGHLTPVETPHLVDQRSGYGKRGTPEPARGTAFGSGALSVEQKRQREKEEYGRFLREQMAADAKKQRNVKAVTGKIEEDPFYDKRGNAEAVRHGRRAGEPSHARLDAGYDAMQLDRGGGGGGGGREYDDHRGPPRHSPVPRGRSREGGHYGMPVRGPPPRESGGRYDEFPEDFYDQGEEHAAVGTTKGRRSEEAVGLAQGIMVMTGGKEEGEEEGEEEEEEE